VLQLQVSASDLLSTNSVSLTLRCDQEVVVVPDPKDGQTLTVAAPSATWEVRLHPTAFYGHGAIIKCEWEVTGENTDEEMDFIHPPDFSFQLGEASEPAPNCTSPT
jgi:hypothetical protein